jgi:hypothetical protein
MEGYPTKSAEFVENEVYMCVSDASLDALRVMRECLTGCHSKFDRGDEDERKTIAKGRCGECFVLLCFGRGRDLRGCSIERGKKCAVSKARGERNGCEGRFIESKV